MGEELGKKRWGVIGLTSVTPSCQSRLRDRQAGHWPKRHTSDLPDTSYFQIIFMCT